MLRTLSLRSADLERLVSRRCGCAPMLRHSDGSERTSHSNAESLKHLTWLKDKWSGAQAPEEANEGMRRQCQVQERERERERERALCVEAEKLTDLYS